MTLARKDGDLLRRNGALSRVSCCCVGSPCMCTDTSPPAAKTTVTTVIDGLLDEEYILSRDITLVTLGCPGSSDPTVCSCTSPPYTQCMLCTPHGIPTANARDFHIQPVDYRLTNYDIFNGTYVGTRNHYPPTPGQTLPTFFLGTTTVRAYNSTVPAEGEPIGSGSGVCEIWQADWYYFFNWCGEVYFIPVAEGAAAPVVTIDYYLDPPLDNILVISVTGFRPDLGLQLKTYSWSPWGNSPIIPIYKPIVVTTPLNNDLFWKTCKTGYVEDWTRYFEDTFLTDMVEVLCTQPELGSPPACVYTTGGLMVPSNYASDPGDRLDWTYHSATRTITVT